MGLIKEHAFLCKSIDIGSLCLRVSSETTDPVIQIVNGNEQDVRTIERIVGMSLSVERKDERNDSEHPRARDLFEWSNHWRTMKGLNFLRDEAFQFRRQQRSGFGPELIVKIQGNQRTIASGVVGL